MRLRNITERQQISRTVIRDTATALGDLVQYVYTLGGQSKEKLAINQFLKNPTPQSWLTAKWVVNSAIDRAAQQPDTRTRAEKWAILQKVTSPIVASATYDMNQDDSAGTPSQITALSRPQRNKFKHALGPNGYVSALSDLGDIPDTKKRHLLKTLAKSSGGLSKAIKADLPNVRQSSRF